MTEKKKRNKKANKIVWIFLFFGTMVFSQNNLRFDDLYSLEKKEVRIKKIDSLLLTDAYQKNNDSLYVFYSDYAYWLYDVDEIVKSIAFEKKAIDFINENNINDVNFLVESYLNLGSSLRGLELAKLKKHIYRFYSGIGGCYSRMYDFYNTLKYYELAAQIIEKNNLRKSTLRNIYQRLANTSLSIGTGESLKKGQKYGIAADSLANLIPTKSRTKYLIKLSLARLYNQNETLDLEKSFTYFNEALEIVSKQKDTSKMIDVYAGIGDLYNRFDQKKSIKALETALNLVKEHDSITQGEIYSSLGLTYALHDDYSNALQNKHRSLAYITGNDFTDIKSIDSYFLLNTPNRAYLFDFLPQLAETYLKSFESTKDRIHLKNSISYFNLADQIIDIIKTNSREFRSRLFWRKVSADIYGKAIKACYLLGDKEQAFYFMEKNKALLLLEDLADQSFKNSLELPKSFLDKERLLKKKILQLKSELTKNTKEIGVTKKELLDTERTLISMTDSIHANKNTIAVSPEIIPLNELQNNLKEDEVFIEYHVSIDDGYSIYTNKENGYVLFVSKNKIEFFEISNLTTFKEEVSFLIKLLETPFKTEKDVSKYAKLSNNVFKKLFPNKTIREQIKDKKLLIAPDSYLSLLPFEALSVSENELSYLILENTIHYLYSYSFLKNNEKPKAISSSFLGMAPEVFKDIDLSPLSGGSEEIRSLQTYYNGTSYINSKASKASFLKELPNHGIIHLATHADAQDSISPWIAFYDEKLKLEELYLTKNNASLVVLSGCNTTLGKQEIGEGVISLARGFFYSGAQSVVSSLWSIDDASTSKIMKDFYHHLSNGQTKSQALRNAKINYLNTHSVSDASPYFWSSFILIGQDDILLSSSNPWIRYILIPILALVIIFYFIRKNKK